MYIYIYICYTKVYLKPFAALPPRLEQLTVQLPVKRNLLFVLKICGTEDNV